MRFILRIALTAAAVAAVLVGLNSLASLVKTPASPHPAASTAAGHAMTPAAACAYLHSTGVPGRITIPTQAELAYAATHIATSTATGLAVRDLALRLHAAQAHHHLVSAAANMTFLTLTCNLVSRGYHLGPVPTHPPTPAA